MNAGFSRKTRWWAVALGIGTLAMAPAGHAQPRPASGSSTSTSTSTSTASPSAGDTCVMAYEQAQQNQRGRRLLQARADLQLCQRVCEHPPISKT